jgi:Fe-S cluster assembly protein SufD
MMEQTLILDAEAYKFTNLTKFMKELELDGTSVPFNLDAHLSFEIPTFVFIDGFLQNPDLKVPGVVTTLFKEAGADSNALSVIHRTNFKDGLEIKIEKNAVVEKPLRLLYLTTRAGTFSPTVRVEAAAFSKATIIEESIGEIESYAQISESFISVAANASLEHIQIERTAEKALSHGSTLAEVARDGNYRNVVLHLSGSLNRRNLQLDLKDSGAHGESYNLYLTSGHEHSDISTVINHLAADSTSSQLAKGILDGESKGIFTGKIHIHPQAQRVASGQLNKNLILSNKAQAHSQPQLEIFADDVKCSHGSTTGQLSADEVFYFQARGIPAEKAKTLLAHGFGLEVVMKIQNKVAHERVAHLVMETLKTKFQLGSAE